MPVVLKGVHLHPENPLLFDFIVDAGDSGFSFEGPQFKAESERLIKYFLASLTVKEGDQWVNLSPYEKDRMIPEDLGKTELGRDMLAQDYILKQLTASLVYPEKGLGKEFWAKVYEKAQAQFGTIDVPVDTFNKVWITADKARVLERNNTAYVVGAHLKVMLESDYMAAAQSSGVGRGGSVTRPLDNAQELTKQVMRDVIIPQIEKEVNEGNNFSQLRQIFYAMILSTWYKRALKTALLNQVYSNKSKTSGVENADPGVKEKIYAQYLEAYRKGVFNYIKEETNAAGETIPRKYFSGGLDRNLNVDQAMEVIDKAAAGDSLKGKKEAVVTAVIDAAEAFNTLYLSEQGALLLRLIRIFKRSDFHWGIYKTPVSVRLIDGQGVAKKVITVTREDWQNGIAGISDKLQHLVSLSTDVPLWMIKLKKSPYSQILSVDITPFTYEGLAREWNQGHVISTYLVSPQNKGFSYQIKIEPLQPDGLADKNKNIIWDAGSKTLRIFLDYNTPVGQFDRQKFFDGIIAMVAELQNVSIKKELEHNKTRLAHFLGLNIEAERVRDLREKRDLLHNKTGIRPEELTSVKMELALAEFQFGGDVVDLSDMPGPERQAAVTQAIRYGLIPLLAARQDVQEVLSHYPQALSARRVGPGEANQAVLSGAGVILVSPDVTANEIKEARGLSLRVRYKPLVVMVTKDVLNVDRESLDLDGKYDGIDLRFRGSLPAVLDKSSEVGNLIKYIKRKSPIPMIMISGDVNDENRDRVANGVKGEFHLTSMRAFDELENIAHTAFQHDDAMTKEEETGAAGKISPEAQNILDEIKNYAVIPLQYWPLDVTTWYGVRTAQLIIKEGFEDDPEALSALIEGAIKRSGAGFSAARMKDGRSLHDVACEIGLVDPSDGNMNVGMVRILEKIIFYGDVMFQKSDFDELPNKAHALMESSNRDGGITVPSDLSFKDAVGLLNPMETLFKAYIKLEQGWKLIDDQMKAIDVVSKMLGIQSRELIEKMKSAQLMEQPDGQPFKKALLELIYPLGDSVRMVGIKSEFKFYGTLQQIDLKKLYQELPGVFGNNAAGFNKSEQWDALIAGAHNDIYSAIEQSRRGELQGPAKHQAGEPSDVVLPQGGAQDPLVNWFVTRIMSRLKWFIQGNKKMILENDVEQLEAHFKIRLMARNPSEADPEGRVIFAPVGSSNDAAQEKKDASDHPEMNPASRLLLPYTTTEMAKFQVQEILLDLDLKEKVIPILLRDVKEDVRDNISSVEDKQAFLVAVLNSAFKAYWMRHAIGHPAAELIFSFLKELSGNDVKRMDLVRSKMWRDQFSVYLGRVAKRMVDGVVAGPEKTNKEPLTLKPGMTLEDAMSAVADIVLDPADTSARLVAMADEIMKFLNQDDFINFEKKEFLLGVLNLSREAREVCRYENNSTKMSLIEAFVHKLTRGAIGNVELDRYVLDPDEFTQQWDSVVDELLGPAPLPDQPKKRPGSPMLTPEMSLALAIGTVNEAFHRKDMSYNDYLLLLRDVKQYVTHNISSVHDQQYFLFTVLHQGLSMYGLYWHARSSAAAPIALFLKEFSGDVVVAENIVRSRIRQNALDKLLDDAVRSIWSGIFLEKLQKMALEPRVLGELNRISQVALADGPFDGNSWVWGAAQKIGLLKITPTEFLVDLTMARFLDNAITVDEKDRGRGHILVPGEQRLVPEMTTARAVDLVDQIFLAPDVTPGRLVALVDEIRRFLGQSRLLRDDKMEFLEHVFFSSVETRELARDNKNTRKMNAMAVFLKELSGGVIGEAQMDRYALSRNMQPDYYGDPDAFKWQWRKVVDDIVRSMEQSDLAQDTPAAKVNGGIDMNGKKMTLDVAREGKGIEMKLDPAMVARFERGDFTGVVPVILKVTPIASPLPLLGMGTSMDIQDKISG